MHAIAMRCMHGQPWVEKHLPARQPLTFAPAALPPGTKLQAAGCGPAACSNSWRLQHPWLLLLLGLHQGCCCTAAWHPGAAPGVDGCLDVHVLDRHSPDAAAAAVTRAVAGWRGACCSKPFAHCAALM